MLCFFDTRSSKLEQQIAQRCNPTQRHGGAVEGSLGRSFVLSNSIEGLQPIPVQGSDMTIMNEEHLHYAINKESS